MRSRGAAYVAISAVWILLVAACAVAVPSVGRGGAPARSRGRSLRAPHPLYAPHPARRRGTIAGGTGDALDGTATETWRQATADGVTSVAAEGMLCDARMGGAAAFISRLRKRGSGGCMKETGTPRGDDVLDWSPRFSGDGTTVVTLRDAFGTATFNVSIHRHMRADADSYPYDDGFAVGPDGKAVSDLDAVRAAAAAAAAASGADRSTVAGAVPPLLSVPSDDASASTADFAPPPNAILLSVTDDMDMSDPSDFVFVPQSPPGDDAATRSPLGANAVAGGSAVVSPHTSSMDVDVSAVTADDSAAGAAQLDVARPKYARAAAPQATSGNNSTNNTTGASNNSTATPGTNNSTAPSCSNASSGVNNSSSNNTSSVCSTDAPTSAPGPTTTTRSTTTRRTTTTRSTTTRATTTIATTSTTSTTTTPMPTNATTTTTAAPTPAPTPAPPTPQPPPPPPKTGWRQVDIQFRVFHDARLADYLRLVSEMAGVTVAQLRVVPYFGLPAVLNGRGYVMTVEFYDPLPNTTGLRVVTPASTVSAATAAIRLEAAVLARLDPRLEHFTIVSAARVAPTARGVEDNVVGVNVLWLGLLLLSFLLVIFSIALLFRRRNSVEEDLRRERDQAEANGGGIGGVVGVDEEGEIEVEIPVPPDESHVARKQLVNMVDRACQRHEEVWGAKRKETGASILQGLDSFEAALGYEQRLRLPPRGLILPTRNTGPKKKLGDDAAPPPVNPDILTAMTTSTDGGDRDTQATGSGDSESTTSPAPASPAGAPDTRSALADTVEMTIVKSNPIAAPVDGPAKAAPPPSAGAATVDELLLSLGSAITPLPASLPPKAKLPTVGVLPPVPTPPAPPSVDPATLLGIFTAPPAGAASAAPRPAAPAPASAPISFATTAKDAANDAIFAALLEGAPLSAAAVSSPTAGSRAGPVAVLAATPPQAAPPRGTSSATAPSTPANAAVPRASPPERGSPGVAQGAAASAPAAARTTGPAAAPTAKTAPKAPVAPASGMPPPAAPTSAAAAAPAVAPTAAAATTTAATIQSAKPTAPKAPAVAPSVANALKTPAKAPASVPSKTSVMPLPAAASGGAPRVAATDTEPLLPEQLLPPNGQTVTKAPAKAPAKRPPPAVIDDVVGFNGPPVPAAATGGAKFTTGAVTDPADLLLSPEVVAAALGEAPPPLAVRAPPVAGTASRPVGGGGGAATTARPAPAK